MSTREKILKAALKLFSKQGVDKTSTASISKEVGVAEGTLFVHFKTKQILVDSLYLSIKEKSIGSLTRHLQFKENAEEAIKIVSQDLMSYFLKNYSEYLFLKITDNGPHVSDSAREKAAEVYKETTDLLIYWQQEKKIKQIDLQLLSGVMWATLSAVITYCREQQIKKPTADHLDLVWDSVKS